MTPRQALNILRYFQAWRREKIENIPKAQPNPTDVGVALDVAIQALVEQTRGNEDKR